MRVLKFGGSSLADADRFSRAADIIANNAQQGPVSVVLSAPGKVTNKLVSVIENSIQFGEADVQLADLEAVFNELLAGLREVEPGFDKEALDAKLASSLGQLKQYVHGIKLLGLCLIMSTPKSSVRVKGYRLS